MNWEQLQGFYMGKVSIIGLNFNDKNGELIEAYQTHGTVIELTNDGMFRIKRKDGSIFHVPFDENSILETEKADYREHKTGILIKRPDFIIVLEVTVMDNEIIELIKLNGFIDFD